MSMNYKHLTTNDESPYVTIVWLNKS